VCWVISKLEGL